MNPKRLFCSIAASGLLAGPVGGFWFGLLNGGDPDPNPIGRFFYGCIMAVVVPLHAGFPPNPEAGAGQTFNVWPHIGVAFVLILIWLVHRDGSFFRRCNKPLG